MRGLTFIIDCCSMICGMGEGANAKGKLGKKQKRWSINEMIEV